MARDFRAKQLRTSVIIGSGSIESTRPYLGLVFYSASKASDFDGTRRTGGSALSSATQLNLSKDAIALPHRFGDDVWCLFDGQSVSQNAAMTTERTEGSTVLFLGDVTISGSLFAERQMIEVDTTSVGNFRTPAGSSAFFDGGFAGSGVDITAGGEVKAFTSVRSPIFLNDGANVTLKTTTSGDVDIHPVSGISKFRFDANSFSTLTVSDGSHTTLATSETGNLTIDSAGTVVLDAASTAAAGISLNSGGGVGIDAAAGPISIDTTHNNAAAINITSNGGTSEKILIKNTQGNTEAAAADGAIKVEATAGGITLDAALDVHISADGGNISFSDGTTTVMDFDVDSVKFKMMDDADTGDYFEIATAANGHTTLATIDDDATSAHLVLDIDGDVYLDPAGGDFIWDLAGTRQGHWAFSSGGAAHVFWVDGNGQSLFSFQNTVNNGTVSSLRMATSRKIEFHDDSQYIHAPSDNNISAVAPHSITLNAGASGTTLGAGSADSGAVLVGHSGVHIGGTGTGAGIASIAANSSPIRIFKATGNLKNANISQTGQANYPFNGTSGDNVATAGDLVISNRSQVNGSSGVAEGKIVFDGAVEYSTISTSGNVIVGGDLTVNGNATVLDTTNLSIKDPFIILASGQTGSPTVDAGLLVERGDSSNVAFIWDETNGAVFRAITTNSAATTSGNVVHTGHAAIAAQQFYLESSSNKIDLSTDIIVTAAADVTFTVGGGNVTPTANNGAALGSADKTWSDLFLADGGVLNFGDDQDVTFTHVHDAGVLLSSGKQIQFGHADENISGNGTDLTIASGGDINLTATGDVNIPASKGLTFGADTNKIEVDGSNDMSITTANDMSITANDMSITAANDMTFQTGGADADRFLFSNGGNTTEETKLCIGDTSTFIERQGGSNNIRFVSDRPIQLDCGGTLTLDGNSGVNIKHGDSATLSISRSTDTLLFANHANDIVFQTNDGGIAEFMRLDTSTAELVLPQGHKVTFDGIDGGESIYADGSQNLQIVAGADINLTPGGNDVTITSAAAQLNFNSSNQRIYLDGNDIKFRDGVQTTARSLSDLASVTPSDSVLLSATGPNRSKSLGGMAISSRSKYVNEANIFADSTPNPSDLFFYVGDDAGSRVNSAFKNNVAISGSISMVDTADSLSSTKFTQTSDNLIMSMNSSTAGAPGAFHNILTIEPAIGLKLGTTGGSGNAGLYFNSSTMSITKATNDFKFSTGNGAATGLIVGDNNDGHDRTVVFGHSTLKTIVGIDDSADTFIINTDAAFDNTLANNSLTIDANHNVGIGGDLTVNGGDIAYSNGQNASMNVTNTAADAVGKSLTITAGGVTGGSGTGNTVGGDLTLSSGASTGTGTSAIKFNTATAGSSGNASSAPAERMRIHTNGYVGIGTASPSAALDVLGTIIANSLSLTGGDLLNGGDINCDSVSVADAAVGLDINFGGNTTLNKITLTDNLADALNITQSGNSYMKFITTNSSEKIEIYKDLIPSGDVDLGSSANRFANIYTNDLNLCNEGRGNDVDGTSGNWTIQEGEDNLYVINNITGKKFKMMLQPITSGEE